jgi:hypothetical protein
VGGWGGGGEERYMYKFIILSVQALVF